MIGQYLKVALHILGLLSNTHLFVFSICDHMLVIFDQCREPHHSVTRVGCVLNGIFRTKDELTIPYRAKAVPCVRQ